MKWNIRQRLSHLVPMRDGVRLSCDIRFPQGDGPFPVILFRTPYNKAQNLAAPEVTRWTRQGYVYIAQDCRGRHESEGDFRPMIQDAADGADTIAWIRRQPFCDGRVAMTGASYCGWTQLAAASSDPDGLVAITPQVKGTEGMDSTGSSGGIMGMLGIWWMLLNTNRGQMADPVGDWDAFLSRLPVNRLDEILGFEPIPAFKELVDPAGLARLRRDHAIMPGLETSRVPILLGVGWYDIFAGTSMRDAARLIELRKRQGRDDFRVIAGPWGHSLAETRTFGELDFGPSSLVDLKGLQNAFIAWQMNGSPLPAMLAKPVSYFLMGANEWRQADCWPPAESAPCSYYLDSATGANSLHGDGTLTPGPATGRAADEYCYDPMNPVPSIGGASLFLHTPAGPQDQRPAERRDDVLCYTSAALEQPLAFAGIPVAEIFAESSAVDTDFFARLCDVHPDGRSLVVCDGGLRLQCREGSAHPLPAVPGECYRIRIELASTAMCLLPGHRLRLEITSSCFPRYVRNLNSPRHPLEETEADAVVAVQRIHHSAERPSRLILPVLPA